MTAAIEILAEEVRAARLPSPARRRAIRERAGLTLREMAGALQVNPMSVLKWEQGRQPTRRNAIVYRQLLEALEEALA